MPNTIDAYNEKLDEVAHEIAETLRTAIQRALPNAEGKVWHGHPVWFLDGNPVTGYATRKDGVALFFWSGQSFDEPALTATGKFRLGEIRYLDSATINLEDVARWLAKAQAIQWDYKNIVKRKGELVRIS